MKKLILIFVCMMLFCCVREGVAGEIPIKWDANTELDLAGYEVHYGSAYRNYTNVIDAGNVTEYIIKDLDIGVYHIALIAYDAAGNKSDFSYEVVTEAKMSKVSGLVIIK